MFLCPTSWSEDKCRTGKYAFQIKEAKETALHCVLSHFSHICFHFDQVRRGKSCSMSSAAWIQYFNWTLATVALFCCRCSAASSGVETERLRGKNVLLKVKHLCKSYRQDSLGVLVLFLFPGPETSGSRKSIRSKGGNSLRYQTVKGNSVQNRLG